MQESHLDEVNPESLTARINAALESGNSVDDSEEAAAVVGRRLLRARDEGWFR